MTVIVSPWPRCPVCRRPLLPGEKMCRDCAKAEKIADRRY